MKLVPCDICGRKFNVGWGTSWFKHLCMECWIRQRDLKLLKISGLTKWSRPNMIIYATDGSGNYV